MLLAVIHRIRIATMYVLHMLVWLCTYRQTYRLCENLIHCFHLFFGTINSLYIYMYVYVSWYRYNRKNEMLLAMVFTIVTACGTAYE